MSYLSDIPPLGLGQAKGGGFSDHCEIAAALHAASAAGGSPLSSRPRRAPGGHIGIYVSGKAQQLIPPAVCNIHRLDP